MARDYTVFARGNMRPPKDPVPKKKKRYGATSEGPGATKGQIQYFSGSPDNMRSQYDRDKAPKGGTRYGGNYAYDNDTGRRKI